MMTRIETSVQKLKDDVENVEGFCHLRNALNASGGSEMTVVARTRIGWMRFRESGKVLFEKRFSLKMNGKVYQICIRSAILYGSETWCLRKKEVLLIIRIERAIIRAMCGVKLSRKKLNRKNTEELCKCWILMLL